MESKINVLLVQLDLCITCALSASAPRVGNRDVKGSWPADACAFGGSSEENILFGSLPDAKRAIWFRASLLQQVADCDVAVRMIVSSISEFSWWGYLHRLYLLRGLLEWTIDTIGNREIILGHTKALDNQVHPDNWAYDTFHYWINVPEQELLSRTKVQLCSPFAFLLKNELPSWDKAWGPRRVWPFFGPWFKMVLSHVRDAKRRNNVVAVYSLLMVKKACFRVPESFVLETMEKHRLKLGTESWSLEELVGRDKWYVQAIDRFRSCLYRLWRGIDVRPFDRKGAFQFYEPSGGASYEASRSMGGQAGAVLRELRKEQSVTGVYGTASTDGELLTMVELSPGHVTPVYGPPVDLDQFRRHTKASPLSKVSVRLSEHRGGEFEFETRGTVGSLPVPEKRVKELLHELGRVFVVDPSGRTYLEREEGFAEVSDWLKGEVGARQLHCVVAPVLEPLKCRLVTKSNCKQYWLAKGLQKTLWNHMARRRPTHLVGCPISSCDIEDVIRSADQTIGLEKETLFSHPPLTLYSIDYEGATDTQNINFTRMAFEAALKAIGKVSHLLNKPGLADMMRSVIYEHVIEYPNGVPAPVKQLNGQLMGSPLSFPILCAVNLCTFWAAWEEWLGHKVDREKLPVLVNGDDMFFAAIPEFHEIWVRYRDMVGYIPSVGKNYHHSNWCTMNSQLFHVAYHEGISMEYGQLCLQSRARPNGKPVPWSSMEDSSSFSVGYRTPTSKHYPVPSWGLLIGQKKVVSDTDSLTLSDSYRESVLCCHDKVRAHGRWMHYHKKVIASVTQDGLWNLFIDPWLGGVGLPLCPGVTVEYTAFQRRVAQVLKSRVSGETTGRLEIRGFNLQPSDSLSFELKEDRKDVVWARRVFGPLLDGWLEDGCPLIWRPRLGGLLSHKDILLQKDIGARVELTRVPKEIVKRAREIPENHVTRDSSKITGAGLTSVVARTRLARPPMSMQPSNPNPERFSDLYG